MTRKNHRERVRKLKLNRRRERSPAWYKEIVWNGTAFHWKKVGQKPARGRT